MTKRSSKGGGRKGGGGKKSSSGRGGGKAPPSVKGGSGTAPGGRQGSGAPPKRKAAGAPARRRDDAPARRHDDGGKPRASGDHDHPPPHRSGHQDSSSATRHSGSGTKNRFGLRGKKTGDAAGAISRAYGAQRDDQRPDGNREATAPKNHAWLDDARKQTDSKVKAWLEESRILRAAPPPPRDPAGLILDPWQRLVFDTLVAGDSVIVDAPTTAGKTRAVEAFFRANINNPGFRACYTTPVKSLSNDKLREFREMFGPENVGIATGDIKENLNAPIVVATLESYRNSLLGVEPDLGRTLAVFDEYHYLQDEGRGSAWEEALILTPPRCQILLLSASVQNAEQFCDWLTSLGEGRKCVLVRTEVRPVPLVHLVWVGNGWFLPESLPPAALKNQDSARREQPIRQEDLAERMKTLVGLNLTPCIVYAGRRLACETLANLLMRSLEPLSQGESEKIGQTLLKAQEEFGGLSFINPKLRHMLQVFGVGFHHSGLAAPARMAIEALVKQGQLRFVVATMGLSLGINFSVRSALITDYQRPGEAGLTDYGPSEVLQMLGRAGRRGKDAVGFSLWPNVESYARLAGARRDVITSRLRNDPTTFLGLVGRGFSLRAIEHFYSKSFRRFQEPAFDLSLITKTRLSKRLGGKDLPCDSPAAEAARFWNDDHSSVCFACPLRSDCHPILTAKASGPLAMLHIHLHRIGALNRDETLTTFGSIARYFPQAGGLLLARMFADGRIQIGELASFCELAAGLALARFKEPGVDPRYKWPFDVSKIEDELMQLYPIALFEEIYDMPFGRRPYPVLRELNPAAGFMVRAWIKGEPWKDLLAHVTSEQFGTGDVMSLLYRTATYLQSIIQADLLDLKDTARTLREVILREPLSYALSI